MVGRHPELAIAVRSPAAEETRQILRAYFSDVVSRYFGRPATEDEIAAAMREDPSDDLTPPSGLLLVAQEEDSVLGCAGLRLRPGHVAEITRVFVVPAARRRGLGSRLLACLEDHARQHRVSRLRLDTRRDLIEGRRLYARHGYREVAPFNSGPYADHWFEKTLLWALHRPASSRLPPYSCLPPYREAAVSGQHGDAWIVGLRHRQDSAQIVIRV